MPWPVGSVAHFHKMQEKRNVSTSKWASDIFIIRYIVLHTIYDNDILLNRNILFSQSSKTHDVCGANASRDLQFVGAVGQRRGPSHSLVMVYTVQSQNAPSCTDTCNPWSVYILFRRLNVSKYETSVAIHARTHTAFAILHFFAFVGILPAILLAFFFPFSSTLKVSIFDNAQSKLPRMEYIQVCKYTNASDKNALCLIRIAFSMKISPSPSPWPSPAPPPPW